MGAGREFQFLEVIGTNVLANEVVRHFSNLTAKECWESAKRVVRAKHALRGIIDFNHHQIQPNIILSFLIDKCLDSHLSFTNDPIKIPSPKGREVKYWN